MSTYTPIGDRLVIQPVTQDVSLGGVIMPEMSQEGINQATVVAAGPGMLLISGEHGPMQCKVGDTVVYMKMTAKRIDEEENLLVVKESEILTIIK